MKPITKASKTMGTPAATLPDNPQPDETAPVEPAKDTDGQEVEQAPAATLPDVSELPAGPEATIALPEAVMIGGIDAVADRLPLGVVLDLLGQDALDRIADLRGSAAISDLAKRMRDTDGRCAPVILLSDLKGRLKFFHGLEAVAVEQGLGSDTVFVVTAPLEEAEYLQGAVSQQWGKAGSDGRLVRSVSPT